MKSQAGRDPLMWAALALSNAYAPESGEFCLRCHVPKGWLEGRSDPSDGSALTMEDLGNGVACLTCHRAVDVVPSPNDEARTIDSQVRNGVISYGVSSYGYDLRVADEFKIFTNVFGATVDLEDEAGGKGTYQIVGGDESDIKAGKVSINSPVARALIGKSEGDTAEVQAPGGVRAYEIVNVDYV